MACGEEGSLSRAAASLLNDFAQVWRNSESEERSESARFGFLWLGAVTFFYPLFLVHLATDINKYYGGGVSQMVILCVAGIVPCALGASIVGWLTLGERGGQSKVRLFLTGFLLPLLVCLRCWSGRCPRVEVADEKTVGGNGALCDRCDGIESRRCCEGGGVGVGLAGGRGEEDGDRDRKVCGRGHVCCFPLYLVRSPSDLTGLFGRRISWDDGAIRETSGGGEVAFLMNDCCCSGEDVVARAPSVGKGWASAAHLSMPCPHAP